ncbi:hypothetical protein [Methanoregula sp.]|uniref:DUF7847 domain-containing protein n=1 Tax=Methanoregula sp. TaxID=2052170 RepID=UPI00236D0ADF|nr:hypothetical protein [Methanoregula sp.]MDD1687165.1 hypothetical protein [Methanoregula sp.]
MAIAELKEACGLLARMPLLWIPGIIGGLLAAALWLLAVFSGVFFAGRLLVLAGLVLLFFVTGALFLIRSNGGDIRSMIGASWQYYFRVLLPLMVIMFMTMLVFVLVVLTLTLIGTAPGNAVMVFLSFGVVLPSLLLTIFTDNAAVFEDRKVFESIQRSIQLVSTNMSQFIRFLVVSVVMVCVILFGLMIVWEIPLIAKLEPFMNYTQEQQMAFTFDQFMTLIGTEGIWVTAAVLFIAGLIIIPLISTYKACFFRNLAKGTTIVIQQQVTGEYDSKGRWYKY